MIAYGRITRAIADYPEPTLREMLRICKDFGLITEFDEGVRGIRMQCVNQMFDVSVDEAEVLIQGLLLRFFCSHPATISCLPDGISNRFEQRAVSVERRTARRIRNEKGWNRRIQVHGNPHQMVDARGYKQFTSST